MSKETHTIGVIKRRVNGQFLRLHETNNKTKAQEVTAMNKSSNTPEVPEAKGALDKFKYEVASEIGVPLKKGYNGDLTSYQNGSVGGEMVRRMIKRQEEEMAGKGNQI